MAVPASFCRASVGLPGGRISTRIGSIAESATLKVDAKAKELKAEGRPVISYAAGEPDFATPEHIVEAAVAAARDPKNHSYTPAAGLPELREAIAAKTLRDSALEVDPSQVIVTNGGKQAVYQSFATLLDPGDEVLLPTPYWTTYPEAIKLAGGVPVEVFAGCRPGLPGDGRAARGRAHPAHQGAAVRVAVEPDRRRVLARADRGDRRVGREHGLWVISDEIYQNLTYDGQRAASIVEAVPALADRTILVNGVAKTYAMTGWRLGWMVGPADAIKAAGNLQSHLSSNVSNISQRAAIAALTGPQDAVGDDAPGVRPPAHADRRAVSTRSTGSSARCPRARSTCTRMSPGCSAASGAASRRPRRSSWPTSSSSRPRSRPSPARRSARAGTCASATRSATPTSPRASSGCRSCSASSE